ncbi:hypothetical protein ACYSNR_06765 [Enterococcus sp. LJL128]|uniref:hypothetical protein n=1 Tax=Enterococcus sp. LJL51 TaxID=3416656 RepID=UPI003CF81EA4
MKKILLLPFAVIAFLTGCDDMESKHTTSGSDTQETGAVLSNIQQKSVPMNVKDYTSGTKVFTDSDGNFQLNGTTDPNTIIYVYVENLENNDGGETWIKADEQGVFFYEIQHMSQNNRAKISLSTDVTIDANGNAGLRQGAKNGFEIEVAYPITTSSSK